MPCASSSISSASPSQPGKREVRVAGQPVGRVAVVDRVRYRRAHPFDQVVAQGADPCRVLLLVLRPPPRPPPRTPTTPGVSSVPERTSRSWPPPCSSGVQSTSRPSSSAPTPTGPPSLCPVSVSAAAPLAGEVDRNLADRLHGVGVERHPGVGRDRGQLGDRLYGADLVVRPLDADHGDVGAVRGRGARGSGRRRSRPAASTGSQVDDRALVGAEPVDRVQDRVVLDCATRPPGRRPDARPEDPLVARLSLSVPPLVKITSDGRAPSTAAMRSRDSSTSRRAVRPAACSDEALPTSPPWRRTPRAPQAESAWSLRDPGMPSPDSLCRRSAGYRTGDAVTTTLSR